MKESYCRYLHRTMIVVTIFIDQGWWYEQIAKENSFSLFALLLIFYLLNCIAAIEQLLRRSVQAVCNSIEHFFCSVLLKKEIIRMPNLVGTKLQKEFVNKIGRINNVFS